MSAIILMGMDDFESAYILTVAEVCDIERRRMTEVESEISHTNYDFITTEAAMAWIDANAKVGWCTRIISDDD